MKKMVLMVSVILLVGTFLMSSQAMAATWYKAKVVSTIARANGTVAIQFEPGVGEVGFVGVGKAQIKATVVGLNKMMATILTAVSMDSEVSLLLNVAPSAVSQDLLAVNLISN